MDGAGPCTAGCPSAAFGPLTGKTCVVAARVEIERTLAAQAKAITRGHVIAAGGTESFISAQLKAERWQRIFRGVYVGYSGPVEWETRLYAVCLATGPGSAICDRSALSFWGIEPVNHDAPITVAVDRSRYLVSPEGVRVIRRARLERVVHPARTPPVVRVEDAVLRVAASRASAPDVGLVLDACRARATTATRLMRALDEMPTLPHRATLTRVLDDALDGLQSWLEHRYVRRVESAHGLPRAVRQQRDALEGHTVWRDGYYPDWRVALEIDGAATHRTWEASARDRRRDLASAAQGVVTVRVAYDDVVLAPCRTADALAQVLRERGWDGYASRCGPACSIEIVQSFSR